MVARTPAQQISRVRSRCPPTPNPNPHSRTLKHRLSRSQAPKHRQQGKLKHHNRRCAKCGGQLHSVKPWRLEDALGTVTAIPTTGDPALVCRDMAEGNPTIYQRCEARAMATSKEEINCIAALLERATKEHMSEEAIRRAVDSCASR